MLSCAPPSSRLSSQSISVPVFQNLLSRNVFGSKHFASGVRRVLGSYRHLRTSSRRWTRRSAVVSGREFKKLGSLLDSVGNLRRALHEKRYFEELGQELCSVFNLEDKTELQDFLASVILSECVYKKVEISWEALAQTVSDFAHEFPPGLVDVDAVQCSLQDVPHNYILASSKSAVYIAFMGTKQPRDLGADVDFMPEAMWEEAAEFFYNQVRTSTIVDIMLHLYRPSPHHQAPPAAHRGFYARAKAVDIAYIYSLAAAQGKRLVLCGHSLGAAVAQLCTIRLLKQLPDWPPANLQCFCFAGPAVGNAALAALVERSGWSDYFHSYLMPEDSVIRLVSRAQQNGVPFNALLPRSLNGLSEPGSCLGDGEQLLLATPNAAAAALSSAVVPGTEPALLSENQAASALASISLDEGEAFDRFAATFDLSDSSDASPENAAVILDRDDAPASLFAAAGGPSAGAAAVSAVVAGEVVLDGEATGMMRELEANPKSYIMGRSGSKRRWALKQLKRVARRAQGSWASATSRMMSKYTPFGNHYFLLPTRQVVSWEQLQRSPLPAGTLAAAGEDNNKGMQGLFTFHRMMSYRDRIRHIIERVGGVRLQRSTEQLRSAPLKVAVVSTIFPTVQITSAVAWLPLLAAPSRPNPAVAPASTATLSSVDDDATVVPQPLGYRSDNDTRARAVADAAAQPRGLGAAVPLPPKKPRKTVAMMIKVDGLSLKQCRSISLRIAGQQATVPVEVTHVLPEPELQATAAANPLQERATPASAPLVPRVRTGPLQHLLKPQPWMLALAPWGIAAGRFIHTVLGAAFTTRRRLIGAAQPTPMPVESGHAVLRVHLRQSVVRRLQEAASCASSSGAPLIELVARSDFHEVTIPVEMRANKVAVLGTTAAASRLVHAALSGQLDLAIGPGNPGSILPYWLRQLPSILPFGNRAKVPLPLPPAPPLPPRACPLPPPPPPRMSIPSIPTFASPSVLQPAASPAVAAVAAALATAASVSTGSVLGVDLPDAFSAAASSSNSIVAASSRLSSLATLTSLRKRSVDTSLESMEPAVPAPPSLEPEPMPRRTAVATTASTESAFAAAQGRRWTAELPTQMLATLWAAPSRLARAASGGFSAVVRSGAEKASEAAASSEAAAAAASAAEQPRFSRDQLLTAPELSASAAPQVVDLAEADLAEIRALAATGLKHLSAGKRPVKLALSASPEAASEAGRRHAAASAWRGPRSGISRASSASDLVAQAELAAAQPDAPPAKSQRWSWFSSSRRAAKPAVAPSVGLQAPAAAAQAQEDQVQASRMHAGVLYRQVGGTGQDAVQQLAEGFKRQEAQVSWWTALWMALRANTVVASWPSTIGLMALVGRAMMSLPSAPLQFFKLIAENASDEHVHALLLVHQAGADDSLLKTDEFCRLVSRAKAADVALVPVVIATPASHPGEVIMAQYAICQASGLPLGCERVIQVAAEVATDLSTLQHLPGSQRKLLGKSLQELWQHLNQELLAKQLQLVNILPASARKAGGRP